MLMPGSQFDFLTHALGSHSREIPSPAFRSPYSNTRGSRAEVNSFPSTSLCYLADQPFPRRVHSHAAAALINFCEGVERDTLLPYLDPIVERLLKLLNADGDPATVRRYVQEQAITTLAMVADASEATFARVSQIVVQYEKTLC